MKFDYAYGQVLCWNNFEYEKTKLMTGNDYKVISSLLLILLLKMLKKARYKICSNNENAYGFFMHRHSLISDVESILGVSHWKDISTANGKRVPIADLQRLITAANTTCGPRGLLIVPVLTYHTDTLQLLYSSFVLLELLFTKR